MRSSGQTLSSLRPLQSSPGLVPSPHLCLQHLTVAMPTVLYHETYTFLGIMHKAFMQMFCPNRYGDDVMFSCIFPSL